MRPNKTVLSNFSFNGLRLLSQRHHFQYSKFPREHFSSKPTKSSHFRSFHRSPQHFYKKKIDIPEIHSDTLKDALKKGKESHAEKAFPQLTKILVSNEKKPSNATLSDSAFIYGLFGCYQKELDSLSNITPVIDTNTISGNGDPVGHIYLTDISIKDQYKAPYREAKAYQYCNMHKEAAIRYAIDFNPHYYRVLLQNYINENDYRNFYTSLNRDVYSHISIFGMRTIKYFSFEEFCDSNEQYELLSDDFRYTFEYEFLRDMSTEKILINVENKNLHYEPDYGPDFYGLIGLAYIALLMDKKEIAETLFARAAKNCEKENPELVQGLALLAWKRGDRNKAQEYFSIVDQLNDHWEKSELWFSRAKIFAAWGEIKIAMELYDAAVKTNPLLLAASYELALLFKKQGSISQTKKQLESVLSQYPNHTEAKEALHQLNTQKKLHFDFFESPHKQDTSSKTFNDNTDHNRPGPKL